MKKIAFSLLLFPSLIALAQQKSEYEGSATKTETTQRREEAMKSKSNKEWWPNQLNLEVLKQQSEKTNPMGPDFDYIKEFKTIDYEIGRAHV